MGQNQANVEIVTDYSTQQHCVRLHIDLSLHGGQAERFRALMTTGDYVDAFKLLRVSTGDKNRGLVDAYEDAFATLVSSHREAA